MKKFFLKTKDGLSIKAYQYGKKYANKPIIIYLRGGNNHPMHSGSMELIPEDFLHSWLNKAVKKNQSVIYATDYRGSIESEGNDDIADKDLLDIAGLFDWVQKKHTNSKVLLYAESMGVFKALSFLSKFSSYRKNVRAVVFKSGVYNLQSMKTFRPLLYGHWRNDYKLKQSDLRTRDSMVNPKVLKNIPTIFFHGTGDTKAPINAMYVFLMQLGANYSVEVFRNGDHGLSNFQDDMYNKIKNSGIFER